MSTPSDRTQGVVLMTYGSATTAGGVAEYFARIYHGSAPAPLVQDFENRYKRIGRSPLIEITERQASGLEKLLGKGYVVRAGMRHSTPFIEEAVAGCRAAGATSLVGIILSPQFSSFITEGYARAFTEAAARRGFEQRAVVAEPWGTEPHFIELLARRVQHALAALSKKYGGPVPVIFTTHSLPQRVVEEDPDYLEQLRATVDAVRKKLDPRLEWYAGYQSAGHTPEAWLKPDLLDLLTSLHKKKAPAVLIAPIQFLADHLEVLYDLDIAARMQCEGFGIAYNRIEMPNADPLFIEAVASITRAAVKTSR